MKRRIVWGIAATLIWSLGCSDDGKQSESTDSEGDNGTAAPGTTGSTDAPWSPDNDTGSVATDTALTCADAPCDPNATCDDSSGVVTCRCAQGYTGDGFSCSDVDECAVGIAGCDTEHGVCTNNQGSYVCGCAAGYHLDGQRCVADPACSAGQTQAGSTPCGLNGNGVYMQECVDGAWENTQECRDPDVCTNGDTQAGTGTCGLNDRGTPQQRCTDGQWTDAGCDDPDTCKDGTVSEGTTSCNDTGVLLRECVEGQWQQTQVCSVDDQDEDLVPAESDPDDNDPTVCGDSDQDTCDDCSIEGKQAPDNDGWDADGDGACELPLDYACMNGAHAAEDPHRLEACILFTYVNQDRAYFAEESGFAAPLQWNEDIWAVAYAHSVDMCTRNFFDHTNPDGDGPSDRAENAGLSYGLAENIAVNIEPGATEWAFMNEPTCRGHRSNILNPQAIEIGIGYYVCDNPKARWDGYAHTTMDFRVNWRLPDNSFCNDESKACQIPPNPPTTATCGERAERLNFCDAPDQSTLEGWGC